ncbi:Na-Ca exchanger/integrin-beta4 [Calothrix sp. NIES-2100]|uniref:M10 family metallopeptidase C-terminal domain-containing protein n=1 Tax=Calothrix sp. NIES-2100 TaxID=1954172 RepID=UPI000B622A6D|nr:Na-Ca exchanger/integrin-beta4 [Calothrix sp. NIES-2100]
MALIPGTNNNDTLTGNSENDTIQGAGGNDSLSGSGGNDSLEGGRGNDTLIGGTGNDVFNFQYEQDNDIVTDFVRGQDKIDVRNLKISDWNTLKLLISNDGENNALITTYFSGDQSQIKLLNINPSLLQASDFIFNAANINDTVNGSNYSSYPDQLFGGLGNDTINALAGNDVLFGEQGDDRLDGGAGNDTLYGGTGNDVFNLQYDPGNDVVIDFVQGQDRIDVRNLKISDWNTLKLLISNDGENNALITTYFSGDQSQIKLLNINPSLLQASDFIFNAANINDTVNGSNYSSYPDQLFGGLGNDTINALAGNDVLFGEQGDDRLDGGAGNDTLYGGTGNDVFNLQYDPGNDVVIDFVQGQDRIDVRNLKISDWNTLKLLISNDGENNALITTYFSGDQSQIKLLNINPSLLQASDFIFNAANINDTVNGSNYSSYPDQLFGGLGNDTINALAGNDVLFGEQGDDRLDGGAGNDTLYGGTGNDVFNLQYDPGNDVVIDFVQGQDRIDVRNLKISDWNTLKLLISNDGENNALITTYFSGDQSQIKLLNINPSLLQASDFIFNAANINDTVNGSNYSSYPDQLFGGLGNDTINALAGNDVLFGEQGDDRLDGGAGNDTLYGGTGNDVFNLQYDPGNDVVIDFVQGQDRIDVRNLKISDWNTLKLLISNDGENNALITTYFSGDQSQIKLLNINPSLLQASDFIFNAANINDTVNGSNYSSYPDQLFGGLGNDTINALAGNDVLFGEQGDDRLQGGLGNDTLYGGTGNDIAVYSGTRSQYQVTSSGGVYTVTDSVANRDGIDKLYDLERIQFSDQTLTLDAPPSITLAVSPSSVLEDGTANLVYTFTRTGSTTNALTVNYNVAGTATFNTDYTQSGAASFTATTGSITFAAGSSTKTLTIDPSADTTFEANETIALTLATGTGYTIGTTTAVTGTITNDDPSGITINLSPSQTIVEGLISPQNAAYTVSLSQASSQTVTVKYATANGTATAGSDYTSTTGTLTFNPGDISKVINIPILNDSISEADETFTLKLTTPTNASLGTSTVTTTITDTLSSAVTTTLPTNVENLTLTGTAAINGTGNAGNNILKGNSANNTLAGGAGNDTYAFAANTALGTDTISETATGGIDTIDFSASTVAVKVNLGVTTSQTVNSNLKLILSGNNVIENAKGGTGNDRLTGNALNNHLSGGAGNDQLQGLAGDDTLVGGLGDDILTGGSGKDKYLFQGSGAFSSTLGVDYISNFEQGQDQIVLSKTTFSAVTNIAGQALTDFAVVTDDEFINASSARIVFSQGSGSLFYNQDGNVLGTGKVFEFARLGNPDITLSSSDFSLVA